MDLHHQQQQAAPLFCAPRCALRQGTGRGRRRRRRKMAVVRLGNGRPARTRLFALRRPRLRWVAALYKRALRRLRASYDAAFRDAVVEGAAMVGAARLHGEF